MCDSTITLAASVGDDSQTTFSCTVCLTDSEGKAPVTIYGDDVCSKCFHEGIEPQFKRHAKDETAPVTWGAGKLVTVESVERLLSAEFLTLYKAKLKEYAMPINDRAYCAASTCGHFLGLQIGFAKLCGECKAATCLVCKTVFHGQRRHHECPGPESQSDSHAFDGLTRGKDYQTCPGCNCLCERRDGCNHIVCKLCREQFCYICGKEAREGDDNAAFDDDQVEDDLEADPGNPLERVQRDLHEAPENPAQEPAEVTLRRLDRRELHRIIQQVNTRIAESMNAHVTVPIWMSAASSLADDLLFNLDIYTVQIEMDQRLADFLRHRMAGPTGVEEMADGVEDEGFQQ